MFTFKPNYDIIPLHSRKRMKIEWRDTLKMKRVFLVGDYSLHEPRVCEMEDIKVFSKMAYLKNSDLDTLYSPLKVVRVVGTHPTIITCYPIVRWQIVEDQNGDVVLAYREASTLPPLHYPNIYKVFSNGRNTLFLRNVNRRFNTFQRLKEFYEKYAAISARI